ncbi:MAG: ribosome maturation factor RimP [bacterium]
MGSRVEGIVATLAQPLAQKLGFEVVDVQYRKEGANWYLRVFIDKETGINLDDCQLLSEQLSKLLDEKDPIPHSYLLEVSSPGIERPLKNEQDFIRFQGKRIKLKTYAPVVGQKNFTGVLQSVKDGQVVVKLDAEQVAIPLDQIAQARLVAEL